MTKKKQLLYRPISTFNLVELDTLKAYIKIPLKTGFIEPFKSQTNASILSDKKFHNSLCLYIDYQAFNNLIINN